MILYSRFYQKPILYLIINNLIPKYEAVNPEAQYVMIDQQIIQTATLIKAANANDVNLENYWSRTREAHAKTDNCKLFDLARTKFGETRLWVHVKLSQCNRDGHQAFKLIWSNQLEVHVLDKRNPKNYKCICALAYHSEKKTHNWKAYVLCHKKCHDV